MLNSQFIERQLTWLSPQLPEFSADNLLSGTLRIEPWGVNTIAGEFEADFSSGTGSQTVEGIFTRSRN